MKNLLLGLLITFSISTYAQQSFNWSKIADYPYKAWGMNACGHNSYLYTFSNCGGGNNTLYRYNPTADKWDTLAKHSGSTVCNTSIVGVGSKLYLIGAGRLYFYDIATDMWDANAVTLPSAFKKDGATAVAIGTDIYYIGGGTPTSKNLYKFNTTNNTFTQMADMTTERENAQVAHLNGKIYVFGGRKTGSALNTIEVYDISTDKWTALSATIDKRYFGYAIADDNHIYLMGGERGTNNYKYKSIELFTPSTMAITQLASSNDMTREHTAHAMSVVGNKIIAAAGFTNTPTNATTDYCEAATYSSTVGILQHVAKVLSFKTYPNPAKHTVTIAMSHPEQINTISTYTITGQHIITHNVLLNRTVNIDVSELPTGTYLVKAIGKLGTQTELLQIVH